MDELRYWLGFNLVRGIGPVRLRRLLDIFGDPETAWNASSQDLQAAKLSQRVVNNLLTIRGTFDAEIAKIMHRLETLGVQVITWNSPEYPVLLSQINCFLPMNGLWPWWDHGKQQYMGVRSPGV